MSKTGLDANFEKFKGAKGFKPSVLYYARTYSVYDADQEKRLILKGSMTGAQLKEHCKDINVNSGASSVRYMKEQGWLIDRKPYYELLPIPAGESFRTLDTDFCKWLLENFDSNVIMVYIWLHRKYACQYRRFALRDIAEQVFGINSWNGYASNKVNKCLDELQTNGLISFYSEHVGHTVLKNLVKVKEKL